jgi:hypothetical protein
MSNPEQELNNAGKAVQDTWDAGAHTVTSLGKGIESIAISANKALDAIIRDPLPVIATVALTYFLGPDGLALASEQYAATMASAAVTAANGGKMEDIALSMAASYAGGKIGDAVGAGTSASFAQMPAAMQATIKEVIISSSGSAAVAALRGGSLDKIIAAGVQGAVSSYVSSGLTDKGYTNVDNQLIKSAVSSATSAIMSGKDIAYAITNSVVTSSLSAAISGRADQLNKNNELGKSLGKEAKQLYNGAYWAYEQDYKPKLTTATNTYNYYNKQINTYNYFQKAIETEYKNYNFHKSAYEANPNESDYLWATSSAKNIEELIPKLEDAYTNVDYAKSIYEHHSGILAEITASYEKNYTIPLSEVNEKISDLNEDIDRLVEDNVKDLVSYRDALEKNAEELADSISEQALEEIIEKEKIRIDNDLRAVEEGYQSNDDKIESEQKGFENASERQEALLKGYTNNNEWENYQTAVDRGFRNWDDLSDAKGDSASSYYEAKEKGFDSYDEYRKSDLYANEQKAIVEKLQEDAAEELRVRKIESDKAYYDPIAKERGFPDSETAIKYGWNYQNYYAENWKSIDAPEVVAKKQLEIDTRNALNYGFPDLATYNKYGGDQAAYYADRALQEKATNATNEEKAKTAGFPDLYNYQKYNGDLDAYKKQEAIDSRNNLISSAAMSGILDIAKIDKFIAQGKGYDFYEYRDFVNNEKQAIADAKAAKAEEDRLAQIKAQADLASTPEALAAAAAAKKQADSDAYWKAYKEKQEADQFASNKSNLANKANRTGFGTKDIDAYLEQGGDVNDYYAYVRYVREKAAEARIEEQKVADDAKAAQKVIDDAKAAEAETQRQAQIKADAELAQAAAIAEAKKQTEIAEAAKQAQQVADQVKAEAKAKEAEEEATRQGEIAKVAEAEQIRLGLETHASNFGFKSFADMQNAEGEVADEYYAKKEGFASAERKETAGLLGFTNSTDWDNHNIAGAQGFQSYDDMREAEEKFQSAGDFYAIKEGFASAADQNAAKQKIIDDKTEADRVAAQKATDEAKAADKLVAEQQAVEKQKASDIADVNSAKELRTPTTDDWQKVNSIAANNENSKNPIYDPKYDANNDGKIDKKDAYTFLYLTNKEFFDENLGGGQEFFDYLKGSGVNLGKYEFNNKSFYATTEEALAAQNEFAKSKGFADFASMQKSNGSLATYQTEFAKEKEISDKAAADKAEADRIAAQKATDEANAAAQKAADEAKLAQEEVDRQAQIKQEAEAAQTAALAEAKKQAEIAEAAKQAQQVADQVKAEKALKEAQEEATRQAEIVKKADEDRRAAEAEQTRLVEVEQARLAEVEQTRLAEETRQAEIVRLADKATADQAAADKLVADKAAEDKLANNPVVQVLNPNPVVQVLENPATTFNPLAPDDVKDIMDKYKTGVDIAADYKGTDVASNDSTLPNTGLTSGTVSKVFPPDRGAVWNADRGVWVDAANNGYWMMGSDGYSFTSLDKQEDTETSTDESTGLGGTLAAHLLARTPMRLRAHSRQTQVPFLLPKKNQK